MYTNNQIALDMDIWIDIRRSGINIEGKLFIEEICASNHGGGSFAIRAIQLF